MKKANGNGDRWQPCPLPQNNEKEADEEPPTLSFAEGAYFTSLLYNVNAFEKVDGENLSVWRTQAVAAS